MADEAQKEEFVLAEEPDAPTGLLLVDLPLLFGRGLPLGRYKLAAMGFGGALAFVVVILALTVWLARIGG